LTEGRQQVFTATNALGLGVNAPTIRVVIHVGVVRRLRDYAQESGRAGRDGAKSEAIIVRGVAYDRAGRVRESPCGGGVDEEMHELISGKGCVRVILDREMDGREDRIGCEEGEEKCRWCSERVMAGEGERRGEEGRWSGLDDDERVSFEQEAETRRAAAHRERASQSEEAIQIQELEDRLEEWKEGCQWCRVWGETGTGHGIRDCVRAGAEDVQKALEMIESLVQWEKFSCCFACGVPQAICDGFESVADGGWKKRSGSHCQYQGVLLACMASIWTRWDDEFTGWVQDRMKEEGVVWRGELPFEKVLWWLTRKIRWGGIESNKMCWVFYQFLAHC